MQHRHWHDVKATAQRHTLYPCVESIAASAARLVPSDDDGLQRAEYDLRRMSVICLMNDNSGHSTMTCGTLYARHGALCKQWKVGTSGMMCGL